MKRSLILLVIALMVIPAKAQYYPSQSIEKPVRPMDPYWHTGNLFQHLDVALSLGTSGIGIEVASPICKYAQVRVGYELMPHFKKHKGHDVLVGGQTSHQYDDKGYRKETNYDKARDLMWREDGLDMYDHVNFTGRFTMQNFKFLVDVFPLADNKKLHLTVGFYWGPSEIADFKNDSGYDGTVACITAYNTKYANASPDDVIKEYGPAGVNGGVFKNDIKDASGKVIHKAGSNYLLTGGNKGTINVAVKTNSIKPYLGVGYASIFTKKRPDIKWAVTGGVMFWGGTPSMYTPDGINMTKDLNNEGWSSVSLISKLQVYPTIGFRVIKNIF